MYFLLDTTRQDTLPFYQLFLGYEKVMLLLLPVQSAGARGSHVGFIPFR